MRIGIGLPAAVPGAPAALLERWAAESEGAGFRSLGVIDRLVYDNVDPLVALAAAAVATERIELMTTVLNTVYRRNAVVLAKQIASVDELSGGRLTAGLGMGGWPEDYAASGVPLAGRGAAFDAVLDTLERAWSGALTGASGRMRGGAPRILIGGLVPAAFERVARWGGGWVAPSFGMQILTEGIAGVRQAWAAARRDGSPRVVVERYFSLGPRADDVAERYLLHYYGRDYFPHVRADTLTSRAQLRAELDRLADAGCDDVVLLPCAGGLDQVDRLAEDLATLAPGFDARSPQPEPARA
jgi:alkanesulfonate monooxygenase SsuD/methylene tetrahydromethanopterin reductase-like flavin-dependent oxidoreductase (luciferase family)